MRIKNKFNVPEEAWHTWSGKARVVFNYMYEFMEQQEYFQHPDYVSPDEEAWDTIRWNVCYLAANTISGYKTIVEELI